MTESFSASPSPPLVQVSAGPTPTGVPAPPAFLTSLALAPYRPAREEEEGGRGEEGEADSIESQDALKSALTSLVPQVAFKIQGPPPPVTHSVRVTGCLKPHRHLQGVYALLDSISGGRPAYKQEGGTGCIFYSLQSREWILGASNDATLVYASVVDQALSPELIQGAWREDSGQAFEEQPRLRVRAVGSG